MFSRLTYAVPGLEMGLAVPRRIMELHQGFITADSDEGKGTVITCFFPVKADFLAGQ